MSQPNGAVGSVQDTLASTKDSVSSSECPQIVHSIPFCIFTSSSCPVCHVLNPEQQYGSVSEQWYVYGKLKGSDIANSVAGPVAQNMKDQASKTQDEFQNVANSRTTPNRPAATGQPLTHYHSMFYNLLSWQNPRASSIAFASTVITIFAARYLNFLHYFFKMGFIVLTSTAALELAGKVVLDSGLTSRFRPKRYYTIPREALERSLEDVEQLINFFCIEAQRIVFAENVPYTLAASGAALLSWGLIKIVPFWGLSLIATSVLFLAPLVYVKNRDVIDGIINHASSIINEQAGQLRDMTAQHTNKATASMKSYAGEYTSKAQNYMARSSGSPLGPRKEEHTLKPSFVAGTTDPTHLPSPPVTEPTTQADVAATPLAPSHEPSVVAS